MSKSTLNYEMPISVIPSLTGNPFFSLKPKLQQISQRLRKKARKRVPCLLDLGIERLDVKFPFFYSGGESPPFFLGIFHQVTARIAQLNPFFCRLDLHTARDPAERRLFKTFFHNNLLSKNRRDCRCCKKHNTLSSRFQIIFSSLCSF